LLSYMSVRHFGLRTYGRVYAAQYGALVLMTGLGPIWVGAMYDLSKDYHGALLVSAGLAVCASVAFLFLPVLPKRWVLV
jgi:cyanate permease